MNFNKTELLNALKAKKIDNGPDAQKFDKQKVLTSLLKSTEPVNKHPENANMVAKIKKLNGDIAEPSNKITFESTWKPTRATMNDLVNKVIFEANMVQKTAPNAFRLDLRSIVIDKAHSVFQITRKNTQATVQLYFPNVNGKITIKVSIEGVDDKVYEVGLEDSQYTINFGASILKSIDELIEEKKVDTSFGDDMVMGAAMTGSQSTISGFSPNWVQNGYSMESDFSKLTNIMALIEQDEEGGDVPPDDDGALDAGSDPSGFGAGDFAAGGAPAPDAGGAPAPAPDAGAGDVNADPSGGIGVDEGDEFTTFEDYANDNFDTSKDGDQFRTIIDLLSSQGQTELEKGSVGVRMNATDIKNGTIGLKNRPVKEIIDAFLQMYPAISGEIKVSDMDEMSETLSQNPSGETFKAWMDGFVSKLTGAEQNDVMDMAQLPNTPIEPMGGAEGGDTGMSMGGDIGGGMDMGMGGDMGGGMPAEPAGADMGGMPAEPEGAEGVTPEEKEANLNVGGQEQNEFPNV